MLPRVKEMRALVGYTVPDPVVQIVHVPTPYANAVKIFVPVETTTVQPAGIARERLRFAWTGAEERLRFVCAAAAGTKVGSVNSERRRIVVASAEVVSAGAAAAAAEANSARRRIIIAYKVG